MIRLFGDDASRGIRRERGVLSRYGFSFAAHHDPARSGCGPLRVINEHILEPGSGFGDERRANMEILIWMVSGRLAHHDSLHGDAELAAGELLHLGAGSGLRHAERNDGDATPVHLFELWIQPDRVNLAPRVARHRFTTASRRGRLCPIASGDGGADSLLISQDVRMYTSLLESGETLDVPLDAERQVYIQIARGQARIGELTPSAGDSVLVSAEKNLFVRAPESVDLLWLDLASGD